jgi:hypothetical protein
MIETAEILTPKMLESNGFELDERGLPPKK